MRSSLTVTPGASAASSRKLRLAVGSLSICAVVTFVATSDVRVSARRRRRSPTTPCSCVATFASEKSCDLRRADLHDDAPRLRRGADAAHGHVVRRRAPVRRARTSRRSATSCRVARRSRRCAPLICTSPTGAPPSAGDRPRIVPVVVLRRRAVAGAACSSRAASSAAHERSHCSTSDSYRTLSLGRW